MPAYIVSHVEWHDAAWFGAESEYVVVTARLEREFGGRHVASGPHEQLEGSTLGSLTSVLEFPTVEAARAFGNHPEYQRVAEIRRAASRCEVLLVDAAEVGGVWPT